MNILLANDDGISAKGIHVLAEALSKLPDVNLYVSAPDTQRSCCGHALIMQKFVELDEVKDHDFGGNVKKVYSCSGFPADCVRLALYRLRKDGVKIDLVCSGINHGPNLGTDYYYSGTLAAARESCVCFTQAIAFSLHSHDKDPDFEVFYDLVPEVVKKTYGKLPYSTLLNVNVPNIPKDQIKGAKVCKQGPMNYSLEYREEIVDGKVQYIVDPNLLIETDCGEEYDCKAEKMGYVTLVPFDLLQYDEKLFKQTEDLDIKL